MTGWAEIARETIERVSLSIPDDATLKARQSAIDAAYPFGERAYWPYKAWCKARRAYLTPYGYRQTKEPAPLFADLPRDPVTGRPVIT
jgi:hypothetical protein